jgi:hypothetical protein
MAQHPRHEVYVELVLHQGLGGGLTWMRRYAM